MCAMRSQTVGIGPFEVSDANAIEETYGGNRVTDYLRGRCRQESGHVVMSSELRERLKLNEATLASLDTVHLTIVVASVLPVTMMHDS